jgi:hypothetical protein
MGVYMSVPVLWPNEKDANNLDQIKDAVATKAREGDVPAAAAFAALMDAETRRMEIIIKEKDLRPGEQATLPWAEKVGAPAPFNQEAAEERLV